MCGICGIVAFSDSFARAESVLQRMTDSIGHRGPDDSGLWIEEADGVALGHRRLSIVDLSAQGHQPMTNEDGRFWITFNGEIYNHGALRRELEAKGHRYVSRTDTETILHLYEDEGAQCVERLQGMFAFAIWDRLEKQLFLARDRLGVKPLYFRHCASGFVFGSEIKALLEHPAVIAELDEESFHHYLSFGCSPSPSTLFRQIHKLAPAEWMRISRGGRIERQSYWSPFSPRAQEQVAAMGEAEQEARLLELLRAAVHKRMMADVQFGVFLSGGLDSSTNVALMAEVMDEPVRTYSVAFADGGLASELPHAERVAKWFGAEHRSIILDEQAFVDFLPKLAYFADEPVADWVNLPLYYLAALARDAGTAVVQVGEGADEMLHGYSAYARVRRLDDRYSALLRRMPGLLRRGAARGAEETWRRLGRGSVLAAFVSETARGRHPFWGGHVVFREAQKRRLLAGRHSGGDSYALVERMWAESARLRPEADDLQRMTYVELRNRLPELLLMRVDKMTMASSVEARVPFLDHELVEFAMALPPDMKVRGQSGKHVLKRAVGGLLPPGIAQRRKQGFSAPVSHWLRGELGKQVQAEMANSSLRETGLLDWSEVDRLWCMHRKGRGDWSVGLWTLYNAALWHDRWIAGRSSWQPAAPATPSTRHSPAQPRLRA